MRFRLFRDRDLGVERKHQLRLVKSHNDDDRQTTPSQLQASVKYTLNDLREAVFQREQSESSPSLPPSQSSGSELDWQW